MGQLPGLSEQDVAEILGEAGVLVDAADIVLEPHDERTLARLPGDRMAWFASSRTGWARLAREHAILRALEAGCRFRAPRLLHVAPPLWDLRAAVPGLYDPTALYHRVIREPDLARRLGTDIGLALAEQHTAIDITALAELPTVAGWPVARDSLWAGLSQVTDDYGLLDLIEACLDRYDADQAGPRVLIHGDLGLHNIALDPTTDSLAGIFDYDGAALADRHHDFRYLMFQQPQEWMLEAAIAAYEPLTGRRIDRERVTLYNTACGIGFLAFRAGHGADEVWCGRTLAEDLAWVEGGLARLGLSPGPARVPDPL